MSSEAVDAYNALLVEARSTHKRAREERNKIQLAHAMDLLMQAAEMCSDDVRLHVMISRTAKLLKY